MLQRDASSVRPAPPNTQALQTIVQVDKQRLRHTVESLAWPRHFTAQPEANRAAAKWLVDELEVMGWQVEVNGPFRNVIAWNSVKSPKRVFGAHYDSVATTPGADDNLSAIAAVLEAARVCSVADRELCDTAFVFFNREEDGLLGSKNFVSSWLPKAGWQIMEAHILEMVGCCDRRPNSQRVPPGLPIKLPSTGDFLGLLANRTAGGLLKQALGLAHGALPEFHVVGLEVLLGVERWFGDLLRSDHAPFWSAKIPTLMWTDTSEFRNPRYHSADDTPDTLDYDFMKLVTQLLILQDVTKP
jgi:Peptidase family M28